MRRGLAVLASAIACATWPAVARGADATSGEVRALATAALRDPAALQRLREIDVVDGRPARLGAALGGGGADVRARLRALAQGGTPAGASAGRAREQARSVLAQRRFRSTSIQTPLRSLRERVGAALRSLGKPFQAAYDWVADRFPGGPPALLVALAAVALVGAAAIAARAGARRSGSRPAAVDGASGGERPNAAHLRGHADRAERRGELDAALRLRFRAGLVELDSRELIELRPALTNSELLRAVSSPTLAGLVDGFEAVAYGGRPARAQDLRDARDGWPRVVEEAAER